jgi:uncharacterized protein (UPF0303 family)
MKEERIREHMAEAGIEIVDILLQRAEEAFLDALPGTMPDNDPHFIAKSIKEVSVS